MMFKAAKIITASWSTPWLVAHEPFAKISASIKVPQRYAVQVSDTTMMPLKTNACNKIKNSVYHDYTFI